jgi:hypothetical protein
MTILIDSEGGEQAPTALTFPFSSSSPSTGIYSPPTRSRVPAALVLFASGGRFHECVKYHIPTAKSSCASPVAMGFEGLCAIHHMTTAETSNFATLYSALSHKDNPLALSVLDPITGDMLEHHQLQRDPCYKTA